MEKRYVLGGGDSTIVNKSTTYASNQDVGEQEKKKTTTRLEFDIDSLIQFIEDRGIKVIWERAYFCTCLNHDTGEPRMDCPKCHGKGIAYLPPKETVMMIQSQGKGVSQMDIGLLDSGTAVGTTRLETRISYRDRFTVPEVLMPQSMVYYVNESRLKKGIPLYYDVQEVTFITTQEKVLDEDDYKIENNRLYLKEEFLYQTVSLNILMTLRYVVSDILKESRYQYTKFNEPQPKFENLPQKLLLKREDVVVLQDPYRVNDDSITEDIEMQVQDPKAKSGDSMLGGFFGGMI
nr:MAG TPA: hypothetical protein [Herelleviridae sp.]